MNKKKVGIISIFFVAFVIFIIAYFYFTRPSNDDKLDVKLYFLNPITNQLDTEKASISKKNLPQAMADDLITVFMSGPTNNNLFNPLSENNIELSCMIEKQVDSEKYDAVVNLNSAYLDLKEGLELQCRSAIVWTITELEFIEDVYLTVGGEPLKRTNSEELGALNRSNVEINPVFSPTKVETKEIILYFSDEQAQGLLPEKRKIEIKQNKSIETQIMEQLIAGPKNDELAPTVPSETKVIGSDKPSTTSDDRTCYINLSKDFIEKHNGGSAGELLTIYSIVNSITEIEDIDKVQFLIEGERIPVFINQEFNRPFERNEKYILEND